VLTGVHTQGHAAGTSHLQSTSTGLRAGQVVRVVQTTSDWDRVDPQLATAVQSGTYWYWLIILSIHACHKSQVLRFSHVAVSGDVLPSAGMKERILIYHSQEKRHHEFTVEFVFQELSTQSSDACCAGEPVPPVAVADPAMHAPMKAKGATQRLQRSEQQLRSSLSNYSYMYNSGRLQMFNAMLPGCTAVPAFVPVQGSAVRCSTVHTGDHVSVRVGVLTCIQSCGKGGTSCCVLGISRNVSEPSAGEKG
jgi:hypothetical protein